MEMDDNLQTQLNGQLKSLEQNLLKQDIVYSRMEDKREELIYKVEEFVSNLKYNENDDGHKLSAKTSAFLALNTLLTSQENNVKNRVAISLKNKEVDTSGGAASAITELLKKIDLTKIHDIPQMKVDRDDSSIEESFSKTNITISDDELRRDPEDYD